VSLLLIFKHRKVIQDTLLYNKIECYNKGVQRSPFTQWTVALTPQNIKGTWSSSSWLRQGKADRLLLFLRTIVFLEVKM